MPVWCLVIAQSSSPVTSLPFLAGVIAVTTILVMLARRRTQQNTTTRGHRQSVAELMRGSGPRRSAEDDLRGVIIELEELARELNAQIDTKYRKLEAVIRHADQRIAALQGLLDAQSPPGEHDAGIDVVIGDDLADTATGATSTIREPVPTAGGTDQRRIMELARAGRSPLDIADALSRSLAEIEFVLRLNRHRPESSVSPWRSPT